MVLTLLLSEGYYCMKDGIRNRSQKTEISEIRSWLVTWEMRLKGVLKGIYPLGVYVLFWFSVILDLSSTILTMNLGPQYQWIEMNPLFYTFGSLQFGLIYLLTNVSLFVLSAHHQTKWGRGAFLLYISIVVHGSLGMKNLIQLLTLQI